MARLLLLLMLLLVLSSRFMRANECAETMIVLLRLVTLIAAEVVDLISRMQLLVSLFLYNFSELSYKVYY